MNRCILGQLHTKSFPLKLPDKSSEPTAIDIHEYAFTFKGRKIEWQRFNFVYADPKFDSRILLSRIKTLENIASYLCCAGVFLRSRRLECLVGFCMTIAPEDVRQNGTCQ